MVPENETHNEKHKMFLFAKMPLFHRFSRHWERPGVFEWSTSCGSTFLSHPITTRVMGEWLRWTGVNGRLRKTAIVIMLACCFTWTCHGELSQALRTSPDPPIQTQDLKDQPANPGTQSMDKQQSKDASPKPQQDATEKQALQKQAPPPTAAKGPLDKKGEDIGDDSILKGKLHPSPSATPVPTPQVRPQLAPSPTPSPAPGANGLPPPSPPPTPPINTEGLREMRHARGKYNQNPYAGMTPEEKKEELEYEAWHADPSDLLEDPGALGSGPDCPGRKNRRKMIKEAVARMQQEEKADKRKERQELLGTIMGDDDKCEKPRRPPCPKHLSPKQRRLMMARNGLRGAWASMAGEDLKDVGPPLSTCDPEEELEYGDYEDPNFPHPPKCSAYTEEDTGRRALPTPPPTMLSPTKAAQVKSVKYDAPYEVAPPGLVDPLMEKRGDKGNSFPINREHQGHQAR